MDDDDEIHSQQSVDSGSPASPMSPRSNGRITVTVAAAPPQNTLTLALPIQQPKTAVPSGGGGSTGGGREDCWSEGATAVLIDAWGERYMELSRGNLKQQHWKDVADIVGSREGYSKTPKTDVQCKNRIDTVKKKYKQEKAKIAAGGGPSKWIFFSKLDHLIGAAATAKVNSAGPSVNVPMGIPMGTRSAPQLRQQQKFRPRPPLESDDESDPEISADSGGSLPPETKRPRIQRELANSGATTSRERDGSGGGREANWGNSVRELSRAILSFGEAYEHAESSKLQQLVEMEKQRMKFAKEMELQRMQFFMKTQMELSQLKNKRVGKKGRHNNNNNDDNHIVNHSDTST